MKIKTVLCVVAHPGDLELMAGGVVLRFAEKGYKIFEVVATSGNKGSYELSSTQLAAVSERETLDAAEVLGLDDVIPLRYDEGELAALPPNELCGQFVAAIRRVQPDILMTWDPNAPRETSRDRRTVGAAAAEAADVASIPLYHPEHMRDGLEPHYVGERYYFAGSAAGADKIVDISAQIEGKIEAICKHESRMKFLLDTVKAEIEAAGISLPAISGLNRDNHRELVETIGAYS